jgi:hypothetical protein
LQYAIKTDIVCGCKSARNREKLSRALDTTSFSRALAPEYACDGGKEICNHVRRFLDCQDEDLLGALWWSLVTSPLEYVKQGEVVE